MTRMEVALWRGDLHPERSVIETSDSALNTKVDILAP